jgi:4-hydroxy-3-methylbut-2-enyl diphosphate reductase
MRIDGPDDLPGDLTGVVAVTAGASAPEDLVAAVVDRLSPARGTEEVHVVDEDEYFPPPRALRDLVNAIDVLGTLALGGSLSQRPPADDRSTGASEVLSTLG